MHPIRHWYARRYVSLSVLLFFWMCGLSLAGTGHPAIFGCKMLSDGAIAWYMADHISPTGTPLPKQFPCAGKGWICAPVLPLCVDGRAYYPANPARWHHACWKQLRFAITKKQYGRFCYRAEGTGTKARFTVVGEFDKHCNGRIDRVTIKGTVNPLTGDVIRKRHMVIHSSSQRFFGCR